VRRLDVAATALLCFLAATAAPAPAQVTVYESARVITLEAGKSADFIVLDATVVLRGAPVDRSAPPR
jgi:cytosine/adenosine deaminase-related metal-dependent hydrolase